MKTEALKSLQTPLKEQYREQPETAYITLKAQGTVGEDVTCKSRPGKLWLKRDYIPRRAVMG